MIELRENEHRTLSTLSKLGGRATIAEIQKTSGLAHSAIMRAQLRLSGETLVKLSELEHTIIVLNEEGETYAKEGLPERRLVEALIKLGGEARIDEAVQKAKLKPRAISIALGWLRRKGWATIQEKKRVLKKTPEEAKRGGDEETLKLLAEKGAVITQHLSREMIEAATVLRRRKLIEAKEKTVRTLELTPKGRKLAKKGIKIAIEVSQLTPELIVTKKWKEAKLRKFDVTAPGPQQFPGKPHPLQQIIALAREIFLEMGFTEIRGPLVETAFWNFDALFTPQDHPAREMQDTFYLSSPKVGKLPEKRVVDAVARTHEDGWKTESRGWGYKWSPKEARRLVLRTHTTAETVKYLLTQKETPTKVFSVDRVYRNEQLTYRNTAEFHQIEGIIVDNDVTLRDLMGTLKTFYNRFGLKAVQFWPSYFPYTEPSAQATVYIPKLKRWIELCGMGMFRPEVLAPLGIENPVLAWGGGLERIAMIELGLADIRLLYNNRLDWIRRTPMCQ